MAGMNLNKLKSTNVMTNPLFIIILLLLGLIIVLAIFRSAAPFLSVGFGLNAHIGELKGSFEIEAFDNPPSCGQSNNAIQLSNPSESNGPSSSNDNSSLFVMYYAEWCGHCKTTKPEFEKLISNYNGNVKIILVNCEDEQHQELVKSQKIKGFPTIRYYPSGISGDHQEYNGGRTQDDFVQYLSQRI